MGMLFAYHKLFSLMMGKRKDRTSGKPGKMAGTKQVISSLLISLLAYITSCIVLGIKKVVIITNLL